MHSLILSVFIIAQGIHRLEFIENGSAPILRAQPITCRMDPRFPSPFATSHEDPEVDSFRQPSSINFPPLDQEEKPPDDVLGYTAYDDSTQGVYTAALPETLRIGAVPTTTKSVFKSNTKAWDPADVKTGFDSVGHEMSHFLKHGGRHECRKGECQFWT